MTREEAIKKLEQRVSVMKFVNDIYADSVDGEALEMALEALKEQSKTTEVEVVRCKDCKYYDYEIRQLKLDDTDNCEYKPSDCTLYWHKHKPDWYCADAERRE